MKKRLLFLDRSISDRWTEYFNSVDEELYVNDIPNAKAADFLAENIPQFECPDPVVEEIYYFRWWSFRKHIMTTPFGRIILEFLPKVSWAGSYNTINCPAAHHIRESRWLADQGIAEEYMRFWMNPETKASLRTYTFGAVSAARDLADVTGRDSLLTDLYPYFVRNYHCWIAERRHDMKRPFFQIANYDGMECPSPDGGDGYRPTINSCMYSEARLLAELSELLGEEKNAKFFRKEEAFLKKKIIPGLWNLKNQFFMTRKEEDFRFVKARELHGYTPWYFMTKEIPEKYDAAWKQLSDPDGFLAPYGPTTVEQRNGGFEISKTGHECQWNGPSWPFSTSVTLTGLANLLHDHSSKIVSKRVWFDTFHTYAESHFLRKNGKCIPWIDENLDPFTGAWLSRDILQSRKDPGVRERGKDYSHSTFADLVITGLCGLRPEEQKLVVDPMLPQNSWDWFLLDGVRFRNHFITIQFDRTGNHYGVESGLTLYVDGQKNGHCFGSGPLQRTLR